MQSKEGESGKNMLKAYGRTIVGMSPIWLMGEAITGKVSSLLCFFWARVALEALED